MHTSQPMCLSMLAPLSREDRAVLGSLGLVSLERANVLGQNGSSVRRGKLTQAVLRSEAL